MTTPAHRFATLRSLTREQCVAALLVGAVVVLLGFASGLGIEPAATPQQAAAPSLSTDGHPGDAPAVATTTSAAAPPIAYVVEPVAPVAIAPPGASEPAARTTAIASSAPTTSTSTIPATTTPPAPPACASGLLTSLLDALLPDQVLTDLGLPSLSALLGSLDGITSAVTRLLSLDQAGLLRTVSDQLPTPALAEPCTTAVGAALPLIADGATISSAVATVEAGGR